MKAFIACVVFLALGSEAGAQTRVSRSSIGNVDQEWAGVWRDSDGELRRLLFFTDGTMHYTFLEAEAAPAVEPRRGDRIDRLTYIGPIGQFSRRDEHTFLGLSRFIQRNATTCNRYAWFAPARVTFVELRASFVLDGRKIDDRECTLTQTPDRIEFTLERIIGVRFVRLQSGGYIHSTYTADRRAFKSVARIHWDYAAMRPSRIRLSAASAGAASVRIGDFTATGTYDFVAESPGTFTLLLEVLDGRGNVIHRDRAVADIPRM